MKKYNPDSMILAVDSHYGVYAPQFFIEQYENNLINPNEYSGEIADIKNGPDNEFYWDSWITIEASAKFDINGKIYAIYQNDDTWLIPDDMELPEDF